MRVGMRGIRVGMQGIRVGMRGITVGIREITVILCENLCVYCFASISPSSFYGQLPGYHLHVLCLAYQAHEFSSKEMRTCGQYKISYSCICVWCESGELGRRRSSSFPCVAPVVETLSSGRVTFRILSSISDGAPLRKQPMA